MLPGDVRAAGPCHEQDPPLVVCRALHIEDVQVERGDIVRKKRLTSALATLGLLVGLSALATTAATTTAEARAADTAATTAVARTAATTSVPRPDHVVVVMFENTSAGSIIGNSSAPYFNQLASTGANFTNAFAIEHPSQPNYLDLFSGSNQGVTDDTCPHTFSTTNEAAQLIAQGLTFTGYSESLPSAGSTACTAGGTNGYARKHSPWVNFTNVPAADNQPFSAFPTDYSQLPTVSWVIPNLCDDIHNCSIATGDTWLKNNLDGYVQWAKTHNSVLITTFDEDDSLGDNQVATLFDGQPVKTGSYAERIDHFSVLRTIEDMYGLPYAGAAATATSITDTWNTGTGGGVTVTPPGNQSGTVGTPVSLQLHGTDTAGGTLTWSAAGLPAGLSINPSTGLISGTPTTAGTSSVTVTATDSTGPSGSVAFTWTISPASGGCTAAQLLGNPGFETGTAAPWTTTSGVVSNNSGEPPHSGSWDAWMDGYGSTHTDTLSQTVTVPPGCTSATLTFYLHVDTAETTTSTAYDKLTVQAGTTTLATYSNLNATSGYVQKSLSLTPYIGQTVALKFTGTEDTTLQTSFVVDDTAVNVS